jgi:L-ascorbate metabolism protein UlaG (beta-lactamase superfamily)
VRLIKYTHSCVRLERDGAVLVVDPGTWSEHYALRGADAVLLTHEHTDHVDVLRLAGLGVPVYGPAGADFAGLGVIPVVPGAEFTAAGFRVVAHGGQHAAVWDGRPDCANLGYLIDGAIYHPGDSLLVPGCQVQTLLVPIQASWMKTAEAVSFVRDVAPERAFGIHDGQVNARGLDSINGWLAAQAGHGYRWLAPGEPA